jgi:hypothetical protein
VLNNFAGISVLVLSLDRNCCSLIGSCADAEKTPNSRIDRINFTDLSDLRSNEISYNVFYIPIKKPVSSALTG